jgi:hypothetical protein
MHPATSRSVSAYTAAMILYHAVLIALTVGLARDWWRAGARVPAAAHRRRMLRDVLVLGGAALALGVPASLTAHQHPLFGLSRLLCQALFGEAIVLSAVVAGIHGRRGQWTRAAAPLGAALVLLAAYAEAYHMGPSRLEVRRHALRLPGASAASPALRVAHLSDIQTPAVGPHERRAVAAAMAGSPDLVLLTGDYLQGRGPLPQGTRRDFRQLVDRLATAPLGAFAVPGDVESDCALFAGTRVVCLEDAVRFRDLPDGQRLALVALSPATSRHPRRATLERLLAEAAAADVRLVMGHAPDFVAWLEAGQVDLALAGHTHGGQVVVPGLGPLVTLSRLPRRLAAGGLNELHGVPVNVSRGIGMERGVAPQIRFLCPPELSLIDVHWPGLPREAAQRAVGG